MTPRRIDSPKNPQIKALVRLKERRDRDREGRFLIEGTREVARARQGGVEIDTLFTCPELLRPEDDDRRTALAPGPDTVELSREAFERVSYRHNPDGIVALAHAWRLDPATLDLPDDALLLVVDGLEKPGNLGALLRTADAVGVDAVFVSGGGTDLFNPNVIRASMGSLFSRPVLAMEGDALLDFLQAKGVRLVATSPAATHDYWQLSYLGPTAVVLGSEHEGLEPRWLEAAGARVSIPMGGLADSLNVATAGALMLYEVLRQRRSPPPPPATP